MARRRNARRCAICASTSRIRTPAALSTSCPTKIRSLLSFPRVHLAEGLATDWWRIFGGRDREHRIQRYRTGFALPDLSFRADGSMFAVAGRSFYSQNPHLRFPFAGEETLPRGAAESTLSRFIEKVVERLAGEGVRNSEVALCWSRVAESRRDPDEQAFCEASGALGLDPYAISEDDARFIERAGRVFSQEPLIEFLAGLTRKQRTVSVPDFVDQVESRPAGAVEPAGARSCRQSNSTLDPVPSR